MNDQVTAFGEASAVAEDERPYRARLHQGWDILGNTNGGYMLATCANAIAAAVPHPDPVTITGHYLLPIGAADVEIEVETIRSGRTLSTATAIMSEAGGADLLVVLATFGHVDTDSEILLAEVDPPELPAVAQCSPAEPGESGIPPVIYDKIDVRIHPDDVGFLTGETTGRSEIRGWFRLRDGERIGPSALIFAADSYPPAVFNAGLPVGWTPTIELTVHVRAIPAAGWLKVQFNTRFVGNGRLEIDGLLWDGDDRLVAQSRQLALVPRAQ